MPFERANLNLLVVEDNPGDFALLDAYLNMGNLKNGHTILARTMSEARTQIRKNEFDVAMLDLTLPDSSGIDSVITLGHLLPRVPIVVFSGHADVETAVQAISLGAQDYLVKGEFDEKLLQKSIHYSIERKKMLERIRQSNERYELVNKATLDTIWEWDFIQQTGTWGDGFLHMFGYEATDLTYSDGWIRRYVHPEDRDRVSSRIRKQIALKQQHWQDEYRFRCRDGSYKDVHDRGFILYDEAADPYKMIGAITDITEKRSLEKELASQELMQQKLITEVTIQAQEKERNELGKELHDNINQVLATVKMYLGLSLDKGIERKDLIQHSLENVNYAIEEIRRISRSLVAPSLGDMGLSEALLELADEINLAKELKVSVVNSVPPGSTIDPKIELMLYRIAQEQINNIRKYAMANSAIITVHVVPGNIFFSIADDGIGFDTEKRSKGIGLKNIGSRVDFYAGTVAIRSAPGQGCVVEINIPVL
jgi:two-component system sensor histidine kinase UhpB